MSFGEIKKNKNIWQYMSSQIRQYFNSNLLQFILLQFYFWKLNVSRAAFYEFILVCLSVCLSVRTSLNFLKIGSLIFSDIVHDDNWPWYLVTDEAIFLKKKIGSPNLGPTSLNKGQYDFFVIFLSLGH